MTTNDVDLYIAKCPKELQEKLQELRKIIKSTAPEAEEKISYGMPYYHYKGRLIYFAPMKNHLGLYIPPPIIEQLKTDLQGYTTTKSAIHLRLDQPLPVSLIKKLIIARMKWNETSEKK